MKLVAAYLLAVLGGNNIPTADDLKSILGSVGAECEDEMIELLLSRVKGRDAAELIAAGMEKMATAAPPCAGGGANAVGAATPGVGGAADASTAVEAKKEDKIEEKEDSDEDMDPFGLFDEE